MNTSEFVEYENKEKIYRKLDDENNDIINIDLDSNIKEIQDTEPGICDACSGSGEGQYDGSVCPVCKGMGE